MMAEPTKQQIGDGQDNFGEAAKQMTNAVKQVSAERGAEAVLNATTNTCLLYTSPSPRDTR